MINNKKLLAGVSLAILMTTGNVMAENYNSININTNEALQENVFNSEAHGWASNIIVDNVTGTITKGENVGDAYLEGNIVTVKGNSNITVDGKGSMIGGSDGAPEIGTNTGRTSGLVIENGSTVNLINKGNMTLGHFANDDTNSDNDFINNASIAGTVNLNNGIIRASSSSGTEIPTYQDRYSIINVTADGKINATGEGNILASRETNIEGELNINKDATLNLAGVISKDGVYLKESLTDDDKLAKGNLNIKSGGTLNNNGTLNSNAVDINIEDGSKFNNNGTFINSGTLNNDGAFNGKLSMNGGTLSGTGLTSGDLDVTGENNVFNGSNIIGESATLTLPQLLIAVTIN